MPKDYIIVKTTADADKDGLHRTVIATPEKIRTSDFGLIVPQNDIFDNWFRPVNGFPGYDFVAENSPLYGFGFRLRSSHWNNGPRSKELERGRNVIVSMQWEAEFQNRLWNLVLEHTDSIIDLPSEAFPSIIKSESTI